MKEQIEQDTQFFYHILRQYGYSSKTLQIFQHIITGFYQKNRRDFPWRNTDNPYYVLISEFMLQQTQTDRVTQKYQSFIARFPDFSSLAAASLREVMTQWQGLGYNRRAFFLHQTGKAITEKFNALCPGEIDILEQFPGIGKATAGAICAFAYNQPVVFLETNIRSVFIHFFFSTREDVSDTDIIKFVSSTLDKTHPRIWYYGLMDYGAAIKRWYQNPSRKSIQFHKQSPFLNSNRQIRGMIMKLLVERAPLSEQYLYTHLPFARERISHSLTQLIYEKLIMKKNEFIII